jgi:hypothetical protein
LEAILSERAAPDGITLSTGRRMRVSFVTVALCLAPAFVLPQALGDAARRQAQDRTGHPPAKAKAYTDADLEAKGDAAAAEGEAETSSAASASPSDGGPQAGPVLSTQPSASEDAVRAQLDREAEERKQQELLWRQRAGQAHGRLDAAKREHDAVCGPGVLVLTGG